MRLRGIFGDATTAGWDNNNKNLWSGTDANKYKFTGFFKAGALFLYNGAWVLVVLLLQDQQNLIWSR
jgi:hypothetical protein